MTSALLSFQGSDEEARWNALLSAASPEASGIRASGSSMAIASAPGPMSAQVPVAEELTEELDADRLYREYAALVSCWIRRLDRSGDTQDTLHEVFLVALRRLHEFRGDSKVSTWLYSITVRVVSGRRRKQRWRRLLWARWEPSLSPSEHAEPAALLALQQEQAAASVYAILDRMSERDRNLLILFELEGLRVDELALVLGISKNSVCVGLHRARERFKLAYAKGQGQPTGGGERVEKP